MGEKRGEGGYDAGIAGAGQARTAYIAIGTRAAMPLARSLNAIVITPTIRVIPPICTSSGVKGTTL